MKYLRLFLCLSAMALLSHTVAFAESYDSETATIQKKGANTAKVVIDKKSFTAPVCFAEGASWTNVKDHYEVSSSTAAGLESGKLCIMIQENGTAQFCGSKCSKSMKK